MVTAGVPLWTVESALSTSTYPRGSADTIAGPPIAPGRTRTVSTFSSSDTAPTAARKGALSWGCCSNAGGRCSAPSAESSTTRSPSTRWTPASTSSLASA